MLLFQYALLSLSRRWRKQTALCLVFALIVAFYASVIFFTDSLRKETSFVTEKLPQIWVQKLAGGRLIPIQKELADSLQNFRGIKKVYPRIWGYYFDNPTGAVFTIMALNNDLKDIPFIKMKNHLQRNILENEVIVGTGFLSLRGLEIGETLTIPNFFGKMQNFKIVGVFEAEADLLTKDLLLVSPKNARQIIGLKEHEITDLGLDLYNPNEIQNLARKIDQNFSSVRVVTLPQLQATYQTLFGWRGGIWVYGSILAMLAFVLLIWEKATGFDEKEKKELGILKALGWQIKEVLWVKFWESFVIAFTASLIGILMAIFHVFVLEAPLLKPFLVGWSVLYPSFRLYPYVDLNSILMILSLAIFPYLFATLIPAWRGAITDPSEIMRG